MKKALYILIAIIGLSTSAFSQDAYFTQFYANPIELNPALTGAMEGTYRVSISYRDQWNGMLDNPYKTFALNADLRFEVGSSGKDYVGAGINFIADKVARYDFNTTGVKLSGAFHKNLDVRTKQYLSGGAYFGILQKNVNVEQLYFNDQFNGFNGYDLSTAEIFPENNYGFFDIGLGLNYAISPSDKTQYTVGVAFAHLNQPSASFGFRTPDYDAPDVKLYSKITGYLSANLELSDRVNLLPRFAIISQGPYLLMNFGSNVRFDIDKHDNNAMQLGAGLRFARDIESLAPSAVYVFMGIELGSFLMGLSYDFNINDLTNERLGQGILEFNIAYIGEYDNDGTFCPTF